MLPFISFERFVSRFRKRKPLTRRNHRPRLHTAAEPLEVRTVPATFSVLSIGAATSATFTDADGDTVSVRIAGSAGTATFSDGGSDGDVDDGQDIDRVVITGASSNFSLTYSFDAVFEPDVDDDPSAEEVSMGDITSTRTILGVYTVPLNVAGVVTGSFNLGSFIGPGFSRGGGLNVDDVSGNGAGIGIDVASLPFERVINIRDDMNADLIVRGNFGGTVNVRGDVTDNDAVDADSADWVISGQVTSTGLLGAVGGNFNADVDVAGVFLGLATIQGVANGTWELSSAVGSTAQLSADRWADVNALSNFGGTIVSNTGDLNLNVGGNVTSSAVITAGGEDGDLDLVVTGSVAARATISAADSIDATVGTVAAPRNVSGKLHAGGPISLIVTGALIAASIDSDSTVDLDIDRGIVDTNISGNRVSLDVTGIVTRTTVDAADRLFVRVTGNVVRSELKSTTNNSTITITGNLVNSTVTNGSERGCPCRS